MPIQIPIVPPLAQDSSVALDILLLGTCQLEAIAQAAALSGHRAHHQLMESLPYSQIPVIDADAFDAVVVSLTLRHIFMEATGSHLGAADMALARLKTPADAEALIERSTAFIERKLVDLEHKSGGLPVFLTAFLEPSFNYLGHLIDAYAPTAPRAVLRELNRRFAARVAVRPNFHFLDLNDIANAVGRMHFHDDVLAGSSHAATISEALLELDRERFVVPAPNSDYFDYQRYSAAYAELFWRQLSDCLRILRQERAVKLVIVDLDDTLWRGVAADSVLQPWARIEGWPIGFVEALLFFKKRGGLLAICSKNDHATTLARLSTIWHGAISEDDFAAIRINWNSKAQNIAEILAQTNILPESALFIDDNPRELDEVRSRFPAVRVLEGRPHDWRRVILQSPEMQVPLITPESDKRTELVRARISREADSLAMSRDEWLLSLQLEATITQVRDVASAEGARALELINKTNQFNTTGKRWSLAEFQDFLGNSGCCLVLSLKDRNIDNGLIGVSLILAGEIVQTVLSCRVFGLGAEIALGSAATAVALGQRDVATARLVDTGKNYTCHAYFTELGFARQGQVFEARSACAAPSWIALRHAGLSGCEPSCSPQF